MKKDLIMIIKDVSRFIQHPISEVKVKQLNDHLHINNFKKVFAESNHGKSHLVRKGQVGDWKNYFSEENSKKWDDWIAQNIDGTDIQIPKN